MENEKITLQDLANYAAGAGFQAYCNEGNILEAIWSRKEDAATVIMRDFFFNGDEDAANKYIDRVRREAR